jgi:Zn-dependent metalloprotease
MTRALILLPAFAAALLACGENGGQGSDDRSKDAAVARALASIAASPHDFATGPDDRFVVRDVILDANGREHVRFDRLHKELPVIGGDMVVHGDRSGRLDGVSKTLRTSLTLTLQPSLTRDTAVDVASREFAGIREGDASAQVVVYARGLAPRLAYEVVLTGTGTDGTPSELHVFVDAHAGIVVDRWDGIETDSANGTGQGFFDGTVSLATNFVNGTYQLEDSSRGGQYTVDMNNRFAGNGTLFTDSDNAWGDGTLSSRQSVAVDAQYGMAVTWDYYLRQQNRNGIGNDGIGAFNRVHYRINYDNAFWSDSCFCMTYGDGDTTTFFPFVSLDVIGHEMTHGVTSRTAGLVYSGESGGLNESTSDIFGTAVEFYAANADDTPDYDIGERLYTSGTQALRYMYRPSKDGSSADCWYSGVGDLDVHYSSGVGNHFFYLLSEGSGSSAYTDATGATTCDGSAVSGIGRDEAERIWYRALSVYMTSTVDYAGARSATLSAAKDLFGADSVESRAVAAAWSAVNVN